MQPLSLNSSGGAQSATKNRHRQSHNSCTYSTESFVCRAIKQGPPFYTIDRKGAALKAGATGLTERFFALHLPFDDINSEEHRDFVRFVAAYSFFALVRESDARIRSTFRDRPEMVRVHDSASHAMENDPRWPDLEKLVLEFEPAHLRS